MTESEDEAGDPKADRRANWTVTGGGVLTIIGGLFLGLFGVVIVFAYFHSPNDILILLGATAFASSALSFIGGFAAFDHDNYALAVVGSAMPAAVFLGGCVIAIIGESVLWTVFFLPLGLMGASGVLLVAVSRGAFFDGSPNDYGRSEEEWRKRIMKSFWGVLGVVAILIILMMVVAKLVPASLDGTMCFLVPVLIGLLFFLSYILWLKSLYWRKRRE